MSGASLRKLTPRDYESAITIQCLFHGIDNGLLHADSSRSEERYGLHQMSSIPFEVWPISDDKEVSA